MAAERYRATHLLDLHREGLLPQSGFCRQEDIGLDVFLANRFGRLYAGGAMEHQAATERHASTQRQAALADALGAYVKAVKSRRFPA